MSKPKSYLAHQVYLGSNGLEIDGVRLPWHILQDVQCEDMGGGRLWALTVSIPAERIILNTPDGETFDSDKEWARQEAVRIVREGMADVLAWLGAA